MAVVCGPYFKGWFFGRGREGGFGEGRGQGMVGGRDGELCRPCKAARSTAVAAAATPHDRPRLYTGSPNPLIRVDSHDRLEGYPPTSPPLLIHPLPFGATHNSPILDGVLDEEFLARTLIRNMPD